MKKPREVPQRDDFYMGMAFYNAAKSKDPNTQVGAVLISHDNIPLGTGYNGPPRAYDDNEIDWDRPNKYPYIKHAEVNAIDHSSDSTIGSILYVTAMPCQRCMLEIADAEISKVIYFNMKKFVDGSSMLANEEEWEITQNLANLGKVQLIQFAGNLNWMRDRIKFMEMLGVFN